MAARALVDAFLQDGLLELFDVGRVWSGEGTFARTAGAGADVSVGLDHAVLAQAGFDLEAVDVLGVVLEQLAALLQLREELVAVRGLDLRHARLLSR